MRKIIEKIKNWIKYPQGNPNLATRKEHRAIFKWIKERQKHDPIKIES